MNELTIFNFNNTPVRTAYLKNQVWFCLIDVCGILEINDRAQLRKRLNQRGMDLIPTLSKGGLQKTYYINEPNLYRAILKSDKPEAQKFENWICEEVLPSIRKTGGYMADKPVTVSEHTRALPSGKKEIVLSAKAREEIGGITKAVVGKALEGCKVIEYVNPIKNILSDDLLTESSLTPMEIETHLGYLLTGLWDYKKSSADMYKLYRLLEACKGLACRYYSYASHLQGHVDFCEHYRGKNAKYFEMNTDALYATVRGMLDTKIELSAL